MLGKKTLFEFVLILRRLKKKRKKRWSSRQLSILTYWKQPLPLENTDPPKRCQPTEACSSTSWAVTMMSVIAHTQARLIKYLIPHTVFYNKSCLLYAGRRADEGAPLFRWGIGGWGRTRDLLKVTQLQRDGAVACCLQLEQPQSPIILEDVSVQSY